MNTWAVFLVRYSGPFLKWNREELQQINQTTRKLMTIHRTLHPRDNVDRLYVPRKGGRRLTSIQYGVDSSIQQLEDYIQKRRGGLIIATRNHTYNTSINRTKISRKQKWEEKQLYGHFKRQKCKSSHVKLGHGYERETESLLIVPQNNAIRTKSKQE